MSSFIFFLIKNAEPWTGEEAFLSFIITALDALT